MSNFHVHVVVVADVDPLAVKSDALAQVIEQQLRRRSDPAFLTLEFRTACVADDPRGRSRWLPLTEADWTNRADIVLDLRVSPSTPLDTPADMMITTADLVTASAMFPEQVTAATLETRRLMLQHLHINAATTDHFLTATDHLALGSLSADQLSDNDRQDLMSEFDRVGALIEQIDSGGQARNEILRLEVVRLRDELDRQFAARSSGEADLTAKFARATLRIEELSAQLDADSRDVAHS